MAHPLEIALRNAIIEKERIADRLRTLDEFLEQTSRLSGIPLRELIRSYREGEFTVEFPNSIDAMINEDDIVDSGRRISQRELENLVLGLIYTSEEGICSVDRIMEELKIFGYDPGGQNKRKNLTTRLWRISEKKGTIIRVGDGEYKASSNILPIIQPDNSIEYIVNDEDED